MITDPKWKMYELDLICSLEKKRHDPKKEKLNLPCIELEHVSQKTGHILGSTESNFQRSSKTFFSSQNVLFGKLRPYLRKYALPMAAGVCSSEFWVLKPDIKICSREYLFYLIQTDKFIQLANVSCGSKMPRADWSYMSNKAFAVPSSTIQKKIITILVSCDQAIEAQQKLIELKEKRLKGWMQKLLNFDVRFPEFANKPILRYEFENVFTRLNFKKFQLKKSNYSEEGIYPIIDQGKESVAGYSNNLDPIKNLPFILFGDHTREVKWIDFECFLGADGTQPLQTTDKCLNKYGFFLLKSMKIRNLGYSRHFSELKRMIFSLPDSKEEQVKISSFLFELNREVILEKEKLTQLKRQKKGLMQKLLSGEVPVKFDDTMEDSI